MKQVNPARHIGKRKAKELDIKTLGTPPPLEPIDPPHQPIDEEPSLPVGNDKKDKSAEGQSTGQSTDQSTNRSIDQSIDIDDLGPVVGKPRAFYITQQLDKWLDDAVRHFQSKGIQKVDRSVVVNALLHNPTHFDKINLDNLRKIILLHLTNKALKRTQ